MVHYLLATEEQKEMVAEVKEICDKELSFEKVKEYAAKNNGKENTRGQLMRLSQKQDIIP